MKRWGSKHHGQERREGERVRRTAGTSGTPWEKGFPGAGFHFESHHHKMIKHKEKKKKHCLLDDPLSSSVVQLLLHYLPSKDSLEGQGGTSEGSLVPFTRLSRQLGSWVLLKY